MPEDSNNQHPEGTLKRALEDGNGIQEDSSSAIKKIKNEDDDHGGGGGGGTVIINAGEGKEMPFFPPGTEGVTVINDNDVLSGRGGGTNLHPGNRQFRDLINLYRRDYLKARKNDKPAISRSIVNSIREKNGRFLKKVEKSGLWYEIGDDAAREKTSQALRQRAPEMRKLLLDHEMEGARAQQQQQQMTMGVPPFMMNMMMGPNGQPMGFNPAMMGMSNQMFNPMLGMPQMMGMPQMDANGNFIQQQQQQPQQQQNQQHTQTNGGMGNNPMGMDSNGGGQFQPQQQMPQQQHPGGGNNPDLQQQQPQDLQQQQFSRNSDNGQLNQLAMMGFNPTQMNGGIQNMGTPGPANPSAIQTTI